ncbi:DEAD/DEAH box helicase, partial [Candidatus Poribacteria bacterium]|nr:DEAD/DEAH box helicase [Candidatus Poribacteria bacterium]
MTMTNNANGIAADALSIAADRGFLNELAQVKARAALEILGADSDHINWTFQKRRLERNGIAGIFSLQTAANFSPKDVDQSSDVKIAALRLAQLWEALAAVSIEGSETALTTAAIGYEIAGYRANAATLAERLSQSSSDWPMAEMMTDFLKRKLLAVVANQTQLETTQQSYEDLTALVGAAADRLLGRALVVASLYLLGGNNNLEDAVDLLDQARDAYSRVSRFAESNMCYATATCLPLMEQRATWELIADASDSGLWKRYLKLIGRGTTGRPIDSRSLSELWPSQVSALQKGLVSSRESMVLRLPTSSGKTRIAEIAIAHQLSTDPSSRCLYVAPFRALVSEIENNFIRLFADLGIRVSSFVGAYDGDEFEQRLAEASDLLIATPERLDLLERTVPEFFDRVRLVILDEGHIVSDSTRGLKYELLMSRLLVRLPETRFMLMSAVVPDQAIEDFATWMQSSDSSIVTSEWRPSVQRVARFEWRGETGVIQY